MFVWFVAFVLSAGAAKAEGSYKVTINGQSCLELLTDEAKPAALTSPLDYQFSDLEGLFFTYLAKMQNLNEVQPSRVEYFLKDMLLMKAEILNDVLSILPYVASSSIAEARQNQMLSSIYQIIDTMGVPGTVYGFEIDDHGDLHFPRKKRRKKSTNTRAVSVAKTEAIGFLGGVAPERDLPSGFHRSIGFGTHTVGEEKPAKRHGGAIQRSVSSDKTDQIMILDGETGGMYVLPISRVGFLGGQADGKVYRLEFNDDILEWVVTVENLNNPTGRIGF